MTRDEILKMEAGREMDALVARRVMGFVDLGPLQFEDLRWQKPTVDGVVVLGRLPRYSTDIAAAWQVVEKLQSMAYWVNINTTCDVGLYDVQVRLWSDINDIAVVFVPAPLAICRAALLAAMEPTP